MASRISRRRFIQTTAGAAGAAAFAHTDWLLSARPLLPSPKSSGIDHIVVVTMENRSFDHMMGWVPGAEGMQAGLTYTDEAGVAFPTRHAPLIGDPPERDFQGCGHPDPDHSYDGGRVQFNGGACDGWLRADDDTTTTDDYPIWYYTDADLQFFAGAARDWTICDQYFSSIMGPTFPNRIFSHCAQTDRIENSFELSTLPTIWDRLAERRVSAGYYFSDVPFLALWGPKYQPISHRLSTFFEHCRTGRLPEVSYVEPRFLGENEGLSNDDHPHADLRNGQAFQNSIYEAVASSRHWKNTMIVFQYDEWGGFFDHVAPSTAPISDIDRAAGYTDHAPDAPGGLRGFRVPAIIMSPFAQRGHVAHTVFDHTSVLRFIEWRWKLDPLTERDATAANLAEALDFSSRSLAAPAYTVDPAPAFSVCDLEIDKWETLRTIAALYGFFV
jgi:phospholipase C